MYREENWGRYLKVAEEMDVDDKQVVPALDLTEDDVETRDVEMRGVEVLVLTSDDEDN